MTVNKRWLQEHLKDPYFKRAKEAGYPSRAAYKLIELNDKDHLFRTGMTVVDLGAAPGGWSVVAKEKIGVSGTLIAIDLLPMTPIDGVTFIQGDFNDDHVLQQLLDQLAQEKKEGLVDVVMSDMAPNISGVNSVDQPRSLHLLELAFDCATKILKPKGSFLAKVFQGSGLDAAVAELRRHFKQVKLRKPNSSRQKSREVYILGSEFVGYNYETECNSRVTS